MDAMINIAPKSAQKTSKQWWWLQQAICYQTQGSGFLVLLWGGYWEKVNNFWKKSGLIEDSPEAMEATNEDALAQNIKDKNI